MTTLRPSLLAATSSSPTPCCTDVAPIGVDSRSSAAAEPTRGSGAVSSRSAWGDGGAGKGTASRRVRITRCTTSSAVLL
jgi:hypothetical protein